MREIFGLVVEAYLDRGQPVGSKTLAGERQPVAGSIRGVMQELEERGLLTHPHTSAGESRPRAGFACSSTGSCRRPRPIRASGASIERRSPATEPIEDALAAATGGAVGLSQAAGVVLAPKQELRLSSSASFRLSADAGAGGAGRA